METPNSMMPAVPGLAATPAPAPGYRETPDTDPLAQRWNKRIAAARTHWEKFHQRVQHNQALATGFDWSADPKTAAFYRPRANLIHGTITSILPNIYARNPEISASGTHKARDLKLFCKTIQAVTNRALEDADLKGRAKMTVRAALVASFGIVKVLYQRDITTDPIIKSRIQDTQDNIQAIERLIADLEDPEQRGDLEAKQAALNQMMAALSEKVEVTAAEGIVLDRVLTDNFLIDPDVCEFWDYKDADWQCQIIPMKKASAEALYKIKLNNAKAYQVGSNSMKRAGGDARLGAGTVGVLDDDKQIAILEIWDKVSQRVFTMAEGCDYWVKEPYSPPKAGERWYPFFLLPFNVVVGSFVAPSMVDLTTKLQDEHNDARDAFNKHRKLCLPGWIAGSEVSEKTIKRYTDSAMGEITIIDSEGKPLQSVIIPRQPPPIDPQVYDTGAVRYDWEQVTGLQDAARGSMVEAKTATEANILQQSLSGRVAEFRDQVEDWLQEIARYTAQILLQELTAPQIERIMGPPGEKMIATPMGLMPVPAPQYDWPELSRDDVFGMIEMKIRAGTTGAPDRAEQQESWGKILPVLQGLITQILQIRASGMDAEPLVNLLRESLARFDERLEIEDFIPKAPAAPTMPPGAVGMAAGGPPQTQGPTQEAVTSQPAPMQ
jgi:hypothetical protein